jgi:hypothetical protein
MPTLRQVIDNEAFSTIRAGGPGSGRHPGGGAYQNAIAQAKARLLKSHDRVSVRELEPGAYKESDTRNHQVVGFNGKEEGDHYLVREHANGAVSSHKNVWG